MHTDKSFFARFQPSCISCGEPQATSIIESIKQNKTKVKQKHKENAKSTHREGVKPAF